MDFHAPAAPDEKTLRLGRLARLRETMKNLDVPAVVLHDPHNVRYATGARNMIPFLLRNPARYVFVPRKGPVILFEFEGCEHLEKDNPAIDEIRNSKTVSYVSRGPLMADTAKAWAQDIAELMRLHCPGERRIGLERIDAGAVACLARWGLKFSMRRSRLSGRARSRRLKKSSAQSVLSPV